MMDDCIFCKIIKKEIPADIVYEDSKTLAFLDIAPQNRGHTLVLPKQHFRNVLDCSDEYLQAIAVTTKKVASAIKEGVKADGFNIESNVEAAAGQVVFHLHTHIIPRFYHDTISLLHNENPLRLSKEEMQDIRAAIQKEF